MGSFNEAKEAEFLLEDIEGSIVLGDRGYWVMKLIEKMKEKGFNLYVRPRGKGGKRLLIVIRKTSNICDIILSNTWGVRLYEKSFYFIVHCHAGFGYFINVRYQGLYHNWNYRQDKIIGSSEMLRLFLE